MADRRPEHCPTCGTATTAVDPPTVFCCPTCEEYVFCNPAPSARVVVVDGDRALLVEIVDECRVGDPPESEWMTPGGHVETGEQPAAAAVRELREETGLRVPPDELTLLDGVARQVVEDVHRLILFYAVERTAVSGTLTPGSDAGDARFWHPGELADSDRLYRNLHAEPARYSCFASLVELARGSL